MSYFVAFGSFAMLLLVDFQGSIRDRLAAQAPQCVDVQIKSAVDFTLMVRTIEVHERHAPAPTFDPRRSEVSIPMRRM